MVKLTGLNGLDTVAKFMQAMTSPITFNWILLKQKSLDHKMLAFVYCSL